MVGGGRSTETPPPLRGTNPGVGVDGKVAFTAAGKSWTEEFNTVALAASALRQRGHVVREEKTWLLHPDSQFILLPQLVGVHALDDGGVRTVTTIQANHPGLVPDGLFEYQHALGDSAADSIRKGFDQWAQMDFPPLLDALRQKPETCSMLEMAFPAKDGKPARVRRAILGPIMHFMETPPAKAGECEAGQDECADGAHPFCPCCLLTKSFHAFQDLIEGNGFYGLRLFAARSDGIAQADCRVNGDDWKKGAQALRDYVGTWPDAGLEWRKQYVVLQSVEKASS
jgi:hypothetical protein